MTMTITIDKTNLGKVIASHMTIYEQPELFLEWINRESTSMADVLKWASEDEIEECQDKIAKMARVYNG